MNWKYIQKAKICRYRHDVDSFYMILLLQTSSYDNDWQMFSFYLSSLSKNRI